MSIKSPISISCVVLALTSHAALALNPQPLPPGRAAVRSMLNPQPLPPGRARPALIWRCRSIQVGDPRKQPPERACLTP
jgi:hypothetical protein